MQRFERNTEGHIIVRDGAAVYVDTPDNYAADAGEAAPAGVVLYIPGLHPVDAAHDARIAGVDALLAAQAARQAAARQAAADARAAAMTLEDKRRAGYAAQGATVGALVVALWEQIIEGRPEAAQQLQAVRVAVKAELPKP